MGKEWTFNLLKIAILLQILISKIQSLIDSSKNSLEGLIEHDSLWIQLQSGL